MTKSEIYYKVLDESGKACHGGSGTWSLPVGRKYGKWMPPIVGTLEPCVRGYHLCREQDLLKWIGPTIYIAEAGKERIVRGDNKVVVREARLLRKTAWNEKTARLFAADCAERVLGTIKNPSIREAAEKAIHAARAYANGEIDAVALSAAAVAARSAAWSAADAAWEAAWSASRAAADAAADAAWSASRAAAGAARSAEYKWQTARLLQYLNGTL